jgi:rare lipoprotein A
MGKDHDVLTNATSVGELLSAMGIEPDPSDRVLPSPSAPLSPNATIRYVSIDVRVRELRVPIPYTTSTRYTDELRSGQIRILHAGIDGLLLERYRLRIVNGRVVERDLLDREVLREAIAAQRLVGRAESQPGGVQVGEASWYSFAPGDGLTAAHPWLPFGTVVTVTNLANGRTVQVVINDRGPFGGRIIDLSDQAFAAIAPLGQGVCQVRLTW